MKRFSADEIASFFEASPLNSLAQPERCYVTNERKIVNFFFCFHPLFIFWYVNVWASLTTVHVYMDLCVPLYFFAHFICVFRYGSGVCKCVGFTGGKKRSLHWFEEPNQRLENFPRLLCSSEETAGLLSASPIFFFLLPPFPTPLIPDY